MRYETRKNYKKKSSLYKAPSAPRHHTIPSRYKIEDGEDLYVITITEARLVKEYNTWLWISYFIQGVVDDILKNKTVSHKRIKGLKNTRI